MENCYHSSRYLLLLLSLALASGVSCFGNKSYHDSFYSQDTYEMGTVSPKAQAVQVLNTFAIYCHSEGEVEWLFNGHKFRRSSGKYRHRMVIKIKEATFQDTGVYTCQGQYRRKANGTITRFQDSAHVYVGRLAQHRLTPKYAIINVGESAYFSCHSQYSGVGEMLPIPWIFENSIHVDEIAKKMGSNSIFIKSATLAHNGAYTCYGLKRSSFIWVHFIASAKLRVYDNNRILPHKVVVSLGETVNIHCISHSRVEWEFEPNKKYSIHDVGNVQIRERNIVIKNILTLNEGYYHCIGTTRDLALKGLPYKYQKFYAKCAVWTRGSISVNPSYPMNFVNDEVKIVCKTYNLVKWTFNNGSLPSNAIVSGKLDEILILSMVTVSNAGTYECTMQDRGKAYSAKSVLVVNPKETTQLPKTNIHRATSLDTLSQYSFTRSPDGLQHLSSRSKSPSKSEGKSKKKHKDKPFHYSPLDNESSDSMDDQPKKSHSSQDVNLDVYTRKKVRKRSKVHALHYSPMRFNDLSSP